MKQGKQYTKIIMLVLVLMVASYILFHVASNSAGTVSTAQAVVYSTSESLSVSGLVVRQEQTIPARYDLVLPTRSEGEKVTVGTQVAVSLLDENARSRQAEIRRLEEKEDQLRLALSYQTQLSDESSVQQRILQTISAVSRMTQRGSLAAVIRVIQFGIPSPESLGIPDDVMAVTQYHQGIVLVTGHAGSGKSTTLACILDRINHTTSGHILTLEDPVEFVHHHDKCIVSQREIYSDCSSYLSALRSALRESPDVILLGEMRDAETIDVAMTAAETGQLLFSSLHTMGAANTVDRIIDAFPANQQPQVRLQLSMVLQAVITQQLVPGVDGRLIPAFEIMYVNPAIRNLIRESKTYQIDSAIQAGASVGMRTMDASLLQLYRDGKIDRDTVLTHCLNYESTRRKLDGINES